MKKNFFSITTAGIIVVILVLYLISFQVRFNEEVIITTFGKPGRVLNEAGLYWKWPWPIQSLYRFDSRWKVLDTKFEETYTRDGKNLIVTASLVWRIESALNYLESVGSRSVAEKNLRSLLRNYKNAVIGKHPLNDFISTSREDLKFGEIEKEMLVLVGAETRKRYGIDVKFVRIKEMALPESITAEVFERMKKERERVAERIRAEGEGESNKIKAEAEVERDRILAMAEAEAKRVMGEGDAVAAQYYGVFEKNQDLAVFLRKIDALRSTLKEKTTIILDTSMSPYDLLQGEQWIGYKGESGKEAGN